VFNNVKSYSRNTGTKLVNAFEWDSYSNNVFKYRIINDEVANTFDFGSAKQRRVSLENSSLVLKLIG